MADPLGFPPIADLLDPYATGPTNVKVPPVAALQPAPPGPLFPSGSGDGDAVISAVNVLQQIRFPRDEDGNLPATVIVPLDLTQDLVFDPQLGPVGVTFTVNILFSLSALIGAFSHPGFTCLNIVLDGSHVAVSLVGHSVHNGSNMLLTFVSSTTSVLLGNISLLT